MDGFGYYPPTTSSKSKQNARKRKEEAVQALTEVTEKDMSDTECAKAIMERVVKLCPQSDKRGDCQELHKKFGALEPHLCEKVLAEHGETSRAQNL